MREVEITVLVYDEMDEIVSKLLALGFSFSEKFTLIDTYMLKEDIDLFETDGLVILQNCILLRDFGYKKYIVYKDKKYGLNGEILSQNKIKVVVESIKDSEILFNHLGYKKIFSITDEVIYYKNDVFAVCIQNIINQNKIYIEIEATDDDLVNSNDAEIKQILKLRLQSLGINTGDNYDEKKALVQLEITKNSILIK